ncbi:MAG: arsenic efflux protein [Bacteroidales bacterium]|nr:arsenic efflux protein [Bacteroidales bacterium]
MNLEILTDVLRNSILITGLVIIMMLLIEYFNIQSKGEWFAKLQGSGIKQIVLGSALGLIPGCLGGFAAVSLFTHRLISFGALVAMMICSSGDEAFVILAMIPWQGLLLFAILFVIAVCTGIIVDKFIFKKPQINLCPDNYEIHQHEDSTIPSIFKASSYRAMLHPSKKRIAILAGVAIFIAAIIGGLLEHDHAHLHETGGEVHGHHHIENICTHNHTEAEEHHHEDSHTVGFNILDERWINCLFALFSIMTLLFTATAKEHFIEEHIWNHVIKKHLLPIFLWTAGALLICQIGIQYLDIQHWISNNMLLVILLAVAIGLIPESGPHLVFVTLFAQGMLPFYVLMVNSIVQDGHTTLPLLAESKGAFFKAKAINMAVGLIIGIACWLAQTCLCS